MLVRAAHWLALHYLFCHYPVYSVMQCRLRIIRCGFLTICLLLFKFCAFGGDASFTNSLAQADIAKKNGDVAEALKIYDNAQQTQSSNAVGLCTLSRCYC